MNSTSDYTICNLDNHTYSSANFPATDSIPSSGYSYSNVNNGLVDTGQLGYGASSVLQQGSAPELSQANTTPTGHHVYQNPGTGLPPGSSPPHIPYGMHPNTCIAPQNTGYGPGDYYGTGGVISNGSIGADLTNTAHLYGGYPDHQTGGHGHIHGQTHCISPTGYGLQNNNHQLLHGAGAQPPTCTEPGPGVTTYKWMTVKRSAGKAGRYFSSKSKEIYRTYIENIT